MNKHVMIKRCRRLRRNQTESEKIFWNEVRNRKINNLKFLRQHPFVYGGHKNGVYYFIADFYCAEKKIIIELDGGIHAQQKEYDENRDGVLQELGLTVSRFKNDEIAKALDFVRSL